MFGIDSVAVLPAGEGYDPPAEDVLYDLVASCTLPTIDISLSVRSVLFCRRTVERINRVISGTRTYVFVISNVAIATAALALLGPAHSGRWLAIPTFVMAMPAPTIQVLMMRYEIVQLLFGTYDFWFFSSMWAASMAVYSMSLADLRVLIIFSAWLSMQTSIMIDTNVSMKESIYFTAVSLVFSVVVIVAVSLNIADELDNFRLLAVNGYELRARDVIVNGWSTCLLVLVRNLYRRRAAIRDHGANKTVVQCLSYRCRVRLRGRTRRRRSASSLTSTSSVSSVSSVQMTRPTASYFQNAKMVQMRCMRSKIKFSARNLVVPWARRVFELEGSPWRVNFIRLIFLVLSSVGGIFTAGSFVPGSPRFARIIALATTSVFCLLSLALYHRQLLKYLVFSFDFAFLSVQLTIMHVALCDLYRWDSRSYSLIAVWLWVHWVLTFDCMPPVIKKTLRLRNRFALIIAVHFVLGHAALVYQLATSKREKFNDRAIVNYRLSDFHVRVTVLPILVSRIIMTFGWSCRIVWRLWKRNDSELIVIQGTVTYINNRRKIKALEAKFQGGEGKSKVQQLARHLTRRLSAFGTAIAPEVSTLSAAEPASTTEAQVKPFVAPTINARLTNIASQITEATRGLPQLQQQLSLGGKSRPGLTMFDASGGPMLFETVVPSRRPSTTDPHMSLMTITPFSMSETESQSPSPPLERRRVDVQAANGESRDSETDSQEQTDQQRFQI